MDVAGRAFVVSGGGSGLGRATAAMLVEAGGMVGLLDVNPAAGAEAEAALGPSAHFIPTDVTDPEAVQAALTAVRERWGPIYGAVNCAGVAIAERLLGRGGPHDLARFERVVHVNLIGTFNLCRLAAAQMADNPPGSDGERGVLVVTASVAAFEGQIGQVAYSASKGGVAAMVLPMARELARLGIRCVGIAPGVFDTPMMAGLPEPARQSLAAQVPFPSRLGRPEEYAALVRHIFENRMLNGDVIRLDGAIRMAPR
jgi:NAD(P)-dependent dehydrogenase (short-subunit alcohol dehydrogenase family)